jgi:hypothetical protein
LLCIHMCSLLLLKVEPYHKDAYIVYIVR